MQLIITSVWNFPTEKEPEIIDGKMIIHTTTDNLEIWKKLFKCEEKIELDLRFVNIVWVKRYEKLEEIPQTIESIEKDIEALWDEILEKSERRDELIKASNDPDFAKYLEYKKLMNESKEKYNKKLWFS